MKKKEVICIIGASGSVGKRMFPFLKNYLRKNYKVEGTYFSGFNNEYERLDVTDPQAIEDFLLKKNPYALVWLCGTKDVKKCEEDAKMAYELNVLPIENLINSIKKNSLRTKVIFISSDYVFDGIKGQYCDTDKCNPSTNYGLSKVNAENYLINSRIDFLIIRTSAIMIYGEGFLGWIISNIKNNISTSLFSNTYFTPTPIEILNKLILNKLENANWEEKILHLAGPRISRYKFGIEIANNIGSNVSVIQDIEADFNKSTFQPDLSLISSKSLKTFTVEMWNELYKEMLYDKIY